MNDSIVSNQTKVVNTRVVATGRKVAAIAGDQVLGRWPNIRAGVRMAKLACIKAEAPRLHRRVLERVFDQPQAADATVQGTLDYLAGLHTDLASEIEAWLQAERSQVALVVCTRKYGGGATTNAATDPVLWLQKTGEARHTYEVGRWPTFLEIDRWLEAEGYVPVDEAATGFRQIDVKSNMVIRRYSREVAQ